MIAKYWIVTFKIIQITDHALGKMNSKWTKDQNISANTKKFLEGNIGWF